MGLGGVVFSSWDFETVNGNKPMLKVRATGNGIGIEIDVVRGILLKRVREILNALDEYTFTLSTEEEEVMPMCNDTCIISFVVQFQNNKDLEKFSEFLKKKYPPGTTSGDI